MMRVEDIRHSLYIYVDIHLHNFTFLPSIKDIIYLSFMQSTIFISVVIHYLFNPGSPFY